MYICINGFLLKSITNFRHL